VLTTINAGAVRAVIAVIIALLEEGPRSLCTVPRVASKLEAGLLVLLGPPLAAVQARRGLRRTIAGQEAAAHRDGGLLLAIRCDRTVVIRALIENLFPETSAAIPAVRRVGNLAVSTALPQEVARFPLALLRIGVGPEAFLEELPRRVRALLRAAGGMVVTTLETAFEMLFDSPAAIARVPPILDALVEKPLGAVLATFFAARPITCCQALLGAGRRGRFTLPDLLFGGVIAQAREAPLECFHSLVLATLRAGTRWRGLTALKAATEELVAPLFTSFDVIGVSCRAILYKSPGAADTNLLTAGGRLSVAVVKTGSQLLLEAGLTLVLTPTLIETHVLGFGGGSQATLSTVIRRRSVALLRETVSQRFLSPGLTGPRWLTVRATLGKNLSELPLTLLLAGHRRAAILQTAPESIVGSTLALVGVKSAGGAIEAQSQTSLPDLVGMSPATRFAVGTRRLHVATPLAKCGRERLTIFPTTAVSPAILKNLRRHHIAACGVDRDAISPETPQTSRGHKD
jgi:hypothetical protein